MLFRETALAGVWVVELERREDHRGHFARAFCRQEFAARGLNPTVAQATTTVARAEAILAQARSQLRPQITANLDSVTLDTETAFEAGVIQPRHQMTFGATVSMPLLALSRLSTRNQARDQVEVATLSTTEVQHIARLANS